MKHHLSYMLLSWIQFLGPNMLPELYHHKKSLNAEAGINPDTAGCGKTKPKNEGKTKKNLISLLTLSIWRGNWDRSYINPISQLSEFTLLTNNLKMWWHNYYSDFNMRGKERRHHFITSPNICVKKYSVVLHQNRQVEEWMKFVSSEIDLFMYKYLAMSVNYFKLMR